MTTLVLTIDDDIQKSTATLAASSRKLLPEWAVAFDSIGDPSFEPPTRSPH